MFELEIRLLELCSNHCFGVRDILKGLGGSHTTNMRLIKEFEQSAVFELIESPNGRGRPKKIVTLSPTGVEILDRLRSVNAMMLKINENDVRNVLEQVKLRRRMIDAGVDPYERFLEMNELAHNIRNSTKSSATI